MCPYARRCRESGKLVRRVIRDREDAPSAIAALEALPPDDVEGALLLFPDEPAAGEASARALRVAGPPPALEKPSPPPCGTPDARLTPAARRSAPSRSTRTCPAICS